MDSTGCTEPSPFRRSAADGLDRRCLAAESAIPDRRYFHVTAYAAALLFTVLVAAVSPLFSVGLKDSSWDQCSIILCALSVIVCLIVIIVQYSPRLSCVSGWQQQSL